MLLLFIIFSLSKQCNEYTESYDKSTVDSAFDSIESFSTIEKENEDIINWLKYYLNAHI